MNKLYVDMTGINGGFGIAADDDTEVLMSGVIIESMPKEERDENKKEYIRYKDKYDIHFIFDDDIPSIDFFTIPEFYLIAADSDGGYIGGIGLDFELWSRNPIYYISKELKCYLINKSSKRFMKSPKDWKSSLTPYDKITIYKSKAEAEKYVDFLDINDELGDLPSAKDLFPENVIF
ncbi:hypothetical protein NE604_06280 [Anaerofustis stercorihominis]|uniref:hypothetical protein n=1 Tax=Anaerofustis stercorihominis TaxID=214853 RepID=UPI00210D53F5|nr:hypothetical protein [Anaerofustis stercorihominis]MCQ4795246.1 hypothetical protein [Anaerofustis stercorihominis]